MRSRGWADDITGFCPRWRIGLRWGATRAPRGILPGAYALYIWNWHLQNGGVSLFWGGGFLGGYKKQGILTHSEHLIFLYICCIYLYLHKQIALISKFYKPKFIRLSSNTIPHFLTQAIKSSELSISHGKDKTFLPPEYTSTRSNHFVHLTREISSLDQ